MARQVKAAVRKQPKKLSENLARRGLIDATEKSKRRTQAATDRLLREMESFLQQSPAKR
ncbi:MAG: hypothetical protein R3D67_21385 [Hyphomicrobiaceae bacterium]